MNPMSIMAQAEKLGIPELQRSIQDGVVPAFIGVPLLQEKVKKAKQMQMGMAAQQPKRPSVAEQVGQEAQQATIADIMKAQALRMQGEMGQTGGISDSLPKPEGYAKGGPIAFAEKGYVDPDFVGPEENSYLDSEEAKRLLKEKYTYNPDDAWYNQLKDWAGRNITSAKDYLQSTTDTGMKLPGQQKPTLQKPAVQPAAAPVSAQTQLAITPATTVPTAPAPKAPPVMGGNAPAPVAAPYAQAATAPSAIDYSKSMYSADETDPTKLIAQRESYYGEDKTGQTLKDYLAQQGEKVAKEEGRAPWMALMQAGLATMAGTSPFALANIGQGGIQGLNAYTKAQEKVDSAKEKMFDLQSKYDMARRAEHISAVNSGITSADTREASNKATNIKEQVARQDDKVDQAKLALEAKKVGIMQGQAGEAARHNKAMEGVYTNGMKATDVGRFEQKAMVDALKLVNNPASAEYKAYTKLKTQEEKDAFLLTLKNRFMPSSLQGGIAPASVTPDHDWT